MITQPTEEFFKDGQWGWDGSRWRKLALIWGFTDRLAENLGGTKSGDGTYSLYSTSVPAGEVHVVEKVSLFNDTTAPAAVAVAVKDGSTEWHVYRNSSPAKSIPDLVAGPFTLKEGDQIRIILWGCLNSDVIKAVVWGYKMVVT